MYTKGNYKQNEKTTYRMGENICKQCDQQGLNLEKTQSNSSKQQPGQKMGRRPKQTFLQRRSTDGQIGIRKDARHC